MKKVYVAPSMQEIKIKSKVDLLIGSPIDTSGLPSNPPGWGGQDPGGTIIPDAPGLILPEDIDTFMDFTL